jgi:nicotinate-nucleotide adenylyltransferase
MRYGVFGGTFDPPHIGHLILAAESLSQLKLDEILWVLTPEPPHKTGRVITNLNIRLEMIHAAIIDNTKFKLSKVDIVRPPPHYAADSLEILRDLMPGGNFTYLLGGDSLEELPTWHDPQRFIDLCDHLGVMCRPGMKLDLELLEIHLTGVKEKVKILEAPQLEISSTEIKSRIRSGKSYRYYLPPGVYAIIKSRGLYSVG